MQTWPVQDAKARFSELLNACMERGPQIVSRRGQQKAVLVSMEQWQQLQEAQRAGSLKEFLLAPEARMELVVHERGHARRRPVPSLS